MTGLTATTAAAALAAVVALLAAAAAGGAEGAELIPGCNYAHSVFCQDVGYQTPTEAIQTNLGLGEENDGLELEEQMTFVDMVASNECKRMYRELTCRSLYPKCSDRAAPVRPCRKVCKQYAEKCERTYRCDSFPTGTCDDGELSPAAPGAHPAARAAAVALAAVAVVAAFVV